MASGIIIAGLVAGFAGALAAAEGIGQELFNSAIFYFATLLTIAGLIRIFGNATRLRRVA